MSVERLPNTPWLLHLRDHLPVAEVGEDPEGVHQVRVAAARLRVWLRLGGRRMLDDDLRWLRCSLGEVRDLDVLMALGPAPPVLEDLTARWLRAREGMLPALAAPRTRGLLQALAAAPAIDAARAGRRARRWSRRALAAGSDLDWRQGPEAALHAFRRRVRRLRYALDWTGRPDGVVKDLSERLGKLNDLFVLRARIERGEVPAGEVVPLDGVEQRISKRRRRFAEQWPRMRSALTEL